jgi:two-component system nitrate/nitrite response regulator NarL
VDLKSTHHGFCSDNSRMPDGFCNAFPLALSLPIFVEFAEITKLDVQCVWLHLSSKMNVAEQVRLVRQTYGDLPLILMSDLPHEMEALAAFSVGAKAYCNTHAGAEVLLKIANVVELGGIWVGESLMQTLLKQAELPPKAKLNWQETLTTREREMAIAVAEGLSNKEIAQKSGITERTVKAHVGAILEKLGVKSRVQLAVLIKQ